MTFQRKTIVLIFSFLLLGVKIGTAQKSPGERGKEQYDDYYYIESIQSFEQAIEEGDESIENYKKVANAYYFNARYEESANWYDTLFEKAAADGIELEAIYHLRYAQSLRATGQSAKAKDRYDVFADESRKVSQLATADDYIKLIEDNSGRYTIENLENINTSGFEFGGGVKENKELYFSKAKVNKASSFKNNRSSWDGEGFLDLYHSVIKEGKETVPPSVEKAKKVKIKIKNKYHISSAVFTKDGNRMYFTRNPKETDENKVHRLKIYKAVKKGNKWTNVESLGINGDNYSTAHPALSPDEDTLYFASDRAGTLGDSDIWRIALDENGQVKGEPENLGNKINTPARESFPYVSENNELYFSSTGHYGLGGLDVFYVNLNRKPDEWRVLNVGEPINSPGDDFAFSIDVNTSKGFFSSNRKSGKGMDDIYSFYEKDRIKDPISVRICGTVYDKETMNYLTDAEVTLYNPEMRILQQIQTDSIGRYCLPALRYEQYVMRATQVDYEPEEYVFETPDTLNIADFHLTRPDKYKPGDDLALEIPQIYFDFDKSDIRPDAEESLNQLVKILHDYPELRIDIRSHTDSRGSDAYNQALSLRRANSTLEYLVSQGIAEDRLTANGFGEHELLNDCDDDATCDEVAHQRNRRSEFIVVNPLPDVPLRYIDAFNEEYVDYSYETRQQVTQTQADAVTPAEDDTPVQEDYIATDETSYSYEDDFYSPYYEAFIADECYLEDGDDLFTALGLPKIYFDFDQSNIRSDAALILDKVAQVLFTDESINIDILSFTDSRGSSAYNQRLSEQRAQATYDYLVSKGVEAHRLTASGYGESQMVNGCTDGVSCTEAEHQLNRRSELRVVK